jgi:hypothetical protein
MVILNTDTVSWTQFFLSTYQEIGGHSRKAIFSHLWSLRLSGTAFARLIVWKLRYSPGDDTIIFLKEKVVGHSWTIEIWFLSIGIWPKDQIFLDYVTPRFFLVLFEVLLCRSRIFFSCPPFRESWWDSAPRLWFLGGRVSPPRPLPAMCLQGIIK